jgi:hypothetical protein
MQVPDYIQPTSLFTSTYAYLSSTSSSWLKHSETFARYASTKLGLTSSSHVLEIASNDGYLLQFFKQLGIPCTGVEPTELAAQIATSKGITTIQKFFGTTLVNELRPADLIIANNVLAHVPDIHDFVHAMSLVLTRSGLISIEFPHLIRLLEDCQFDTIYHEHYSYLSLNAISYICIQYGLQIVDVEQLNTHGGSLRVWLGHNGVHTPTSNVTTILTAEITRGLNNTSTYVDFASRALSIKLDVINFLASYKAKNYTICAYGAAAKGNTLLNYAGIDSDIISAVFDKAPSKIGKYMPGSHIPIYHPDKLNDYQPDILLVLPWNIVDEIKPNYPQYKLYIAIPTLQECS